MLDTFYLAELLDQKGEKAITMIISKSRKAALPYFCVKLVLLLIPAVGRIKVFCFLSFARISTCPFRPT